MINEQPVDHSPPETFKKIDWEKAQKSLETVVQTSERGWAINAASLLDESLRDLLGAFFIDDKQHAGRMFQETGALSTFKSRIELAYLLGLISKRECRMLTLIRRIRNDFSHKPKAMSFSRSPIKERCLELDAIQVLERSCDPNSPQDRFLATFSFLLMVLSHRTERLQRREEPESITEDYVKTLIKELSGKSTVTNEGTGS